MTDSVDSTTRVLENTIKVEMLMSQSIKVVENGYDSFMSLVNILNK